MKIVCCSKCKQSKSVTEFPKHTRDGYQQPCRKCRKCGKPAGYWEAYWEAWKANRPKYKRRHKKNCEKDQEKARLHRRTWYARHGSGSDKKRSIAIRQATPKWADMKAISNIYAEARLIGMEVDHIIPLQNHIVCGLHVEHNMQILSKSENSRKGNSFAPIG